MENKQRKARIVYWESDGKFIDVRYTQEDGQRVCATFERVGWRKPPVEFWNDIMKRLKRGPTYFAGRKGRQSSSSLEPGKPPLPQDQ